MSRRQRKMREKRWRHAPPTSKRVRAATLSGSLAATAALGIAANAETGGSHAAEAAGASGVGDPNRSPRAALAPARGESQADRLTFASSVTGTTGVNGARPRASSRAAPDLLLAGVDAAMVRDIYAGAADSSPVYLTNVGGTLFFGAYNGPDNGTTHGGELWKSNGTEAGTELVKDIYPGGNGNSYPYGLTDVGGTLFLSAYDGSDNGTTQHGYELWKSNGTGAGTELVKDIYPYGNSYPSRLTNFGGTLFFSADDGAYGRELWKSNGTDPGTELVEDINTLGSSNPYGFTDVGGTLLFSATDGTNGIELWKTDGTVGNATLVEDINTLGSSDPRNLTNVGGTLFFSAIDGNGRELWKSEDPFTDAELVEDINPGAGGSIPDHLTDVGGTLLLRATEPANGYELWKSEPPFTDAQLVKDINPGAGGSNLNNLTNVGGTLLFTALDATGFELWRSDGTGAGTTQVKDINPGPGSGVPSYLTDVGGALFFAASDGVNGRELWGSDGTGTGTTQVKDINTSGSSNPNYLADVGGTLFFSADDGATNHGRELWKAFSPPGNMPPPQTTATSAEDPKCGRLRKKLKRQNRGLSRAAGEALSRIERNIRDTRARLRRLDC